MPAGSARQKNCMTSPAHPLQRAGKGTALEVLLVFLRLGLSSFGGPIAHIGYFRDEFVTRRRWLDEQSWNHGAVAVLLHGQVRLRTVVSQGCRPIGRPLVVTRARQNVIEEIGIADKALTTGKKAQKQFLTSFS